MSYRRSSRIYAVGVRCPVCGDVGILDLARPVPDGVRVTICRRSPCPGFSTTVPIKVVEAAFAKAWADLGLI